MNSSPEHHLMGFSSSSALEQLLLPWLWMPPQAEPRAAEVHLKVDTRPRRVCVDGPEDVTVSAEATEQFLAADNVFQG